MPFYREYDESVKDIVVNRNRTGPPVPAPARGRTQAEDGTIVGASTSIAVTPPKPIPVKMPGPRDKVLNADGTMNPRWWRFLEELHRRTGALEDNVNWAEISLGHGTAGSITLTGLSPSAEITHNRATSAASMSLTGAAPSVTVA